MCGGGPMNRASSGSKCGSEGLTVSFVILDMLSDTSLSR